jgi:hypothetical protein
VNHPVSKKKFVILALLLAMSLTVTTYAKSTAPLPPILDIEKPSAEVSANLQPFSGMWEGSWSGASKLDHILVVEKMTATTAEVIYSIGALESSPPRYLRSKATLNDSKRLLKMEWPQGLGKPPITVMYQLKSDTELVASWDNGQGAASTAAMKKVQ